MIALTNLKMLFTGKSHLKSYRFIGHLQEILDKYPGVISNIDDTTCLLAGARHL
jgi:hypothetical protein